MDYFAIRVNIADRGARYLNEDGSIDKSKTGHVWYTLINYRTGAEYNFGFHPSEDGEFYTKLGLVRVDDSERYLDIAYQKTLPISGESYNAIYNFSQNARANNTYGSYFGPGHACVQFTYAALASGGIYAVSAYIDSGGLTGLWPANNKAHFDTLFESWMAEQGWKYVYYGNTSSIRSTPNPNFSFNNSTVASAVVPVLIPTHYFLEFELKAGDGWDTLEAIYGVAVRALPEYGTILLSNKKVQIEVTGDELAKLYYNGKLRPGDRGFAIVGDDGLLSHLSAHFSGEEITADSLAQLNMIEKHLVHPGQTITIFSLPNSVHPEESDQQETGAQTAKTVLGLGDVIQKFWELVEYYYGLYLGPENFAWIVDEDNENYHYYEQVKQSAWDTAVATAAEEMSTYLPAFVFSQDDGNKEPNSAGDYIFGHKIGAQYAMAGLADFNMNGSKPIAMSENKFSAKVEDQVTGQTSEYVNFLDILGERESTSNYKAQNELGYLGKYQMGEFALADAGFYHDASGDYYSNEYKGTWTDKAKAYGVTSAEAFLNSPKAQEVAVRDFHQKIWDYVQARGYDQHIGSEVHGIKVTASGLIAACHLVGIDGVGQLFGEPGNLPTDEAGIPIDGNGTKSTEYLQKFGGFDLTDLLGYNPGI